MSYDDSEHTRLRTENDRLRTALELILVRCEMDPPFMRDIHLFKEWGSRLCRETLEKKR